MSEQVLREQLYEAFKHRAILYYLIYDELRKEVGPERAEDILSRAIYRRGVERGQQRYAKYAPRDLLGLKDAFLGNLADGGRMFQPEVLASTNEQLDIKFHACPLRDAWQQYGLSPEDVALMCRIASRIDDGTFEGAGFRFWADTWQPGGEGCCCLHIRPK